MDTHYQLPRAELSSDKYSYICENRQGFQIIPRAELSSDKYSYICENRQGFQIITRHHVIVRRNKMLKFLLPCAVFGLMAFICTLLSPTVRWHKELVLLGCVFYAFWLPQSCIEMVFNKILCAESVVVMPTIGVQLETYYRSGKFFRRFVPMGNILGAVINEAVTPFTCYWYLALIVREERKLALVFQELQPPLDMLVPIWKFLCGAIANKMLQQSNNGD